MIMQHRAAGERRFTHYVLTALAFVGIVLGLAVLAHVSWNMFAPDMFGLPAIRMKQALGLVVFSGLVGFLLTHGLKPRRSRQGDSRELSEDA